MALTSDLPAPKLLAVTMAISTAKPSSHEPRCFWPDPGSGQMSTRPVALLGTDDNVCATAASSP
jgi:hypothetical protein